MLSSLIRKVYASCSPPVRRSLSSLNKSYGKLAVKMKMTPIRVDACLLGGDNQIPAATFSRMVGDLLRASRPIAEWPQVKLLRQFDEVGEKLWSPEVFEQTEYYRNAVLNIELCGRYHSAIDFDQIRTVAGSFVARYLRKEETLPSQVAHNDGGDPIIVRPIKDSSRLQVVDGHHRLAIAFLRGIREVPGLIERPAVTTPVQNLLLDGSWLKGKRELYQPIVSPELEQWIIVRHCSDRLTKMLKFLQEEGIAPDSHTYLDVASFYGWFVAHMAAAGFQAEGVERDPSAIAVGRLMFGLTPEQTHRAECISFLRSVGPKYDVTSCFSLAHHFVLNDLKVSAEELLHLVDSVTGRVMFFDMGQSHEYGGGRLSGWDADFIHKWLTENASFSRVVRLGIDEDGVPPFETIHGRMLFACVR